LGGKKNRVILYIGDSETEQCAVEKKKKSAKREIDTATGFPEAISKEDHGFLGP